MAALECHVNLTYHSSIPEVCDKVGLYSPHKRGGGCVRVLPFREFSPRKPTTPEMLPLVSPRFTSPRQAPARGETTSGRFFGKPHATFDVCDRAAYARNKQRHVSQWRELEAPAKLSKPATPRAEKTAAATAAVWEPPKPPPHLSYADRALPMLDREKEWLLSGAIPKLKLETAAVPPSPRKSPRDRLDELKASRSARVSA
jgi:hypothetical protein